MDLILPHAPDPDIDVWLSDLKSIANGDNSDIIIQAIRVVLEALAPSRIVAATAAGPDVGPDVENLILQYCSRVLTARQRNQVLRQVINEFMRVIQPIAPTTSNGIDCFPANDDDNDDEYVLGFHLDPRETNIEITLENVSHVLDAIIKFSGPNHLYFELFNENIKEEFSLCDWRQFVSVCARHLVAAVNGINNKRVLKTSRRVK
jgi:hypothetical protein